MTAGGSQQERQGALRRRRTLPSCRSGSIEDTADQDGGHRGLSQGLTCQLAPQTCAIG